jgi:hypothetical protein
MRSRLLLIPVLAIISMHYESEKNRHISLSNLSDSERLARLEQRLDGLRQELKIPALSAALVKDQKVIWAKGFGFADLEKRVPATEHTSYHLPPSPRHLPRPS